MRDPTQRFSSRVENYIRYRPGYPGELLAWLRTECGLTPEAELADIGSGTGKLAELFLADGNRVFGVEPNQEMRAAGERLLKEFPQFTSIIGTAEATMLPERSVDFITAGQSFHWFDVPRCRAEFARIMKPGGQVVLVWNDRREATPFLAEYELLLRKCATDYSEVNHRRMDAAALDAFYGGEARVKTFCHVQHFDFQGLAGRLLSSSYAPEVGQAGHQEMLAALNRIFDMHQQNGHVAFEYDTRVYSGCLV